MKRLMVAAVLAASVSLRLTLPGYWLHSRAQSQESFSVSGAVEKPSAWTVDRLSKEMAGEIKSVDYTLKGEKRSARCVSLLNLLRASKPKIDPKRKGHMLAMAAIVRAKDGYTVAFSMGEILPEQGGRAVWLALDGDGKPLKPEVGPVQIVVPDDSKPSRWIHAISSITLVDGSSPESK